jgi:phage terminase large subunit-like protein
LIDVRRAMEQIRRDFIFYEPHDKQREFHNLGKDANERIFLGGNRTGKSLCGIAEVSFHLTGNYPEWWQGYRFSKPISACAASISSADTREYLQYQYLGNPSANIQGFIHKSYILRATTKQGVAETIDTAYIRHVSGGVSKLRFKSYDQGREKFQGTKDDLFHFDEEPPMDVYSEALMRLVGVGKAPGLMICTMTPLKGMSGLMMRFFGEAAAPQGVVQDGKVFLTVSWDDNPYIPQPEKERLRKSTPPHELEAREKGIPSLGSGMVYPVSESEIIVDPFEIPAYWPKVYGLDFGWTAPTAATFIAHDRDADIAYIYAEYAASQLTPQSHASNLFQMEADWIPGWCDPAGQQSSQKDGEALITMYLKSGLTITKANNSKESGVQMVLERMQTGRLKIFKNCVKTITELRVYARDDNGIIKKGNDHLMDAMRYAIASGLGLAKKNPSLYQFNPQISETGWGV